MRRRTLALLLALVGALATAPAATSSPRGVAQILDPHGAVIARSSVALGWAYPEDGSVVQIADSTIGSGAVHLIGISALGGRVQAAEAVVGGPAPLILDLMVDGARVAAAPNTPVLLPGLGWLIALQSAVVAGTGGGPPRTTSVALRIHLDAAYRELPAGAEILIGYLASGTPLGSVRLTGAAADIPAALVPLYRAAGRRYGVPWNVLAAIGKVESDHGRSGEAGITSGINSFGCCAGPMQFSVPPAYDTWGQYGVDGDGDGRKDVYDPADAIPAAARMLAANHAQTNLAGAIYVYNHAWWYVQRVLDLAKAYAAGARLPAAPAPAAGVAGGTAAGRVDPVALG